MADVGGDGLSGGRRTALLNTSGVSMWSHNVVIRSEVVGGHEKRLKEMTWNCWSLKELNKTWLNCRGSTLCLHRKHLYVVHRRLVWIRRGETRLCLGCISLPI